MPVTLHAWRRLPRFWAAVLVLAVLWLTLWGQWHRTLHPQAWGPRLLGQQADTAVLAASHLVPSHLVPSQLGHDEGSGLCHLLDHLGDGTGLPSLPGLSLGAAAPTRALALAASTLAWAWPRLCDARAPPTH